MKKSVQDITEACTSGVRLLNDCVDALENKQNALELRARKDDEVLGPGWQGISY